MILIEIPKLTLQYEIAEIEDMPTVGYSELYAAGVKAALQWLIDGKKTPHEQMAELFGEHTRLH